MATNDVPGANAVNKDILGAGAWAEHKDGSLIFVKGHEKNMVVFEIYDSAADPIVFYQDAMNESDFKKQFSVPPTGISKDHWTWHDKTPFPWDRVMKTVKRPVPTHADVGEQLSAAARVGEALKLRAQRLAPEDVETRVPRTVPKGGAAIRDRIQRALDPLADEISAVLDEKTKEAFGGEDQ